MFIWDNSAVSSVENTFQVFTEDQDGGWHACMVTLEGESYTASHQLVRA